MKTVFVANPKNKWLMEGARHYAHKHIPNLDLLTCYTPPEVNQWAQALGAFVESINEDYMLLMLDDYWVQSVDVQLLREAERKMNSNIDKVDLSGDRLQWDHFECDDANFVLAHDNAKYRTSLQAAIWSKKYLLKFCRKRWNPWDFEMQGSEIAKGDGVILGTSRPCMHYINVLHKGKWYGKDNDFYADRISPISKSKIKLE